MERNNPTEGNGLEGSWNYLKLKIKKIIKTSLIDWEGKIVSTLYVPHCNFRCPFCYNCDLILDPESIKDISLEKINDYLYERKDFIDGICMSGGEPTLFSELPEYFQFLKEQGYSIKLDTNGTNPRILKKIIDSKLVDYIAMDIKSALTFPEYSKASGIKDPGLLHKVKKSIDIIMQSEVDYEFRTTVVPKLHNDTTIINISKYIFGAKKYILQNFSPQERMLDITYKKIVPYSELVMQNYLRLTKKYIVNSFWR